MLACTSEHNQHIICIKLCCPLLSVITGQFITKSTHFIAKLHLQNLDVKSSGSHKNKIKKDKMSFSQNQIN